MFYNGNNSWGSSSTYEFDVDVNFSEIEGIEIKRDEPVKPSESSKIDEPNSPPRSKGVAIAGGAVVLFLQLWLGALLFSFSF